jgi:hypothetical protein
MSNKLIIPFDGAKASDIESGGVTTSFGFETLRSILESSAALRILKSEKITGFVIDDYGVKIRIDKRKLV